jgi:phosphatidylglycerophosphate synthase
MIKAKLGKDLDATIRRLLPFLFRHPVDPNLLSALGVVVSLGAAAAFAMGAFRVGAVAMLAGGFFDLIDGVVARHHGTASRFGAFLDSTLDRIVDMALLLGILMHYAAAGETGVAWLAGVALVATVTVSYAKARAEALLPELRGGIFERGERIVVLVAGALFGLMPLALGIVAAGSTVTAVQRVALAHRRLEALDAADAGRAPPSAGSGDEPTGEGRLAGMRRRVEPAGGGSDA